MNTYSWIYKTANLRSKVKVMNVADDFEVIPENLPGWNLDGSSTLQAPGSNSQCLLKAVRVYPWADNHYFVMCEVNKPDGTPHPSNHRAALRKLHNDTSG